MYQLGFVTGRKMQVIPWGKLEKDPSSWISAECFPRDFGWKDPSHIQVGEVLRLLNYWRDRQVQGLDPLIWVQSSALFEDVVGSSRQVRTVRQARAQQHIQDSDEEVFVLPSSGSSDEEDVRSDDNDPSDESLSARSSSNSENEGSMNSDVGPRPMLECEHHIYLLTLSLSHMHHVVMEDASNEGSAVPPHKLVNTSRTSDLGAHLVCSLYILLICISCHLDMAGPSRPWV